MGPGGRVSAPDTSGPAFPVVWHNEGDQNNSAPDGATVPPFGTHQLQGMTLRQWYAGQALSGLCAEEAYLAGQRIKYDQIALRAWAYADAMLRNER